MRRLHGPGPFSLLFLRTDAVTAPKEKCLMLSEDDGHITVPTCTDNPD